MRIGIDIDEIIRNRWLEYDKYYAIEFGDDTEPVYTLDLFEEYKWKDTSEEIKIMREDIPEEISPIDYQVDESGESNADPFLFTSEVVNKTAKENFEEFIYLDYMFEIFGSATLTEPKIEIYLYQLVKKYPEHEFVIFSNNDLRTIPSTLFFCSKLKLPIRRYEFYDNVDEIVDNYDMIITTNTKITDKAKDENKDIILAKRPYNDKYEVEKSFIYIEELLEKDFINGTYVESKKKGDKDKLNKKNKK